MIFIIIAWLVLIFIGLKLDTAGVREVDDAWGKKQFNVLKGICAIEIMIGHIGFVTESPVLFINRKAGVLFVGIFLFLSGYGLMYCRESKENYLQGFWRRKIVQILGPAYLIYILFQFINWTLSYNISYLYNMINPRQFFESNNWFVWEILGLYLLFSVLYKKNNLRVSNILILIISSAFVVFGFIMKIDNPWYGSTMCFGLGIYFCQRRKHIYDLLNKYFWWIILIGSGIVFLATMFFFILGNESFWGNPIARNIAASTFCIVIVTALSKLKIENKVSDYLGKCSYEIYLVHPYVLAILPQYISAKVPLAFGFVAISLIIALGSGYLREKMRVKSLK